MDLESTRMSPVACAKCGKKFRLKLQLRQHERGHSQYRPYCCKQKQCGKIFSHFSDLQNHSRIHSQHWMYQCSICKHHFPSWRSLQVHLLSHPTVRQYSCHECRAAFSHHYSLAYHMWREHRQRNIRNRQGRYKAKMKRPCLNISKPLENNNKMGYCNGIFGRYIVRKELDAGTTDNSDSEFNDNGRIDNGDLSVRLSQKIANHIRRQRRKRKILFQKSIKEIGETKKKQVEIGELLRMKNKKLNAKSPVKIPSVKFNRSMLATIKYPSIQLSDMAINKGLVESGSILSKSVCNGEMTIFEQLNNISSKGEDIPLARFKLHGKNIQELDNEKRVKFSDDGDDTEGLECPDDVVMIDLDGNTPSSEGEPYSDDDMMEEEEIIRHAQFNINTIEIKQNSLIQSSLSSAVVGIDNNDEVFPATVSTFIIEQDLIYPDDKVSLIKDIDDVRDEKNDFSKAFNSFVAISKCKKHTVDDSGVEMVSDTSSQRISSSSSHFYTNFTSECDVSIEIVATSEKKSDQPTGSEENNNSKSLDQCNYAVGDGIEQCTDLETDIPCVLSQISSSTDQSRKAAERAPDLYQQQFLSFLSAASRDDNDCNESESIRNRRSKRGQNVFCHCCFGQHEERRHRHKSEEKKYRLPRNYRQFVQKTLRLVQIREKLHQLFLVLFPKCKDMISEIRPVSEKFDKLIYEIVQILHLSDDLTTEERFDHQAVQASINSNMNDHVGRMGKDNVPSKDKIGVDARQHENCQHIEKSTSELHEGINCWLCCDTQNRNILASTQNLSSNCLLDYCCKHSKTPNLDKGLFNPLLNPITDSQAVPCAYVQNNSDKDNVDIDINSSPQKQQAFHIAEDAKEGAEISLDSDGKFQINSGPLDKKFNQRQPCSKEIQCMDVIAGNKVGEHERAELRDENNSFKLFFNHECDSEVKEGKECGNNQSSIPQSASDIAVPKQQDNCVKTPQKENVSDNNFENDKSEKKQDNSSETKITPTNPVSIEQSQGSSNQNMNFHVDSVNSTGNNPDIDCSFAECDTSKTVMTERIGIVDKKLVLIDLSVPQVSLCKNPDKCLNSLQKQLYRLIHFLLPDLTLRTSIYKNWDNLELLLDLLIKCNQERQMEGDSEPVEGIKSRIENCGFDCEEGLKSEAPKLDVAVQSDFQDEEVKNLVFASDSLKNCTQVELPYHSSSENEDIVFPGLERLQSLNRMDVADDRSVTSFVSSPESEMENITSEINREMDQLSSGLNKASENSHRKLNSQTTFHGFEFTCTDSDSEPVIDNSIADDKSSSISSSLLSNRTRSSKDKNIFELLQPTHISASLS
ncbi:hypothetical protein CHS0354_011324 [Potamilus streckersoni]|uniref:C2H2-type domain-containing protein n=1 Tax=Potamilus streckersoni TaxID=2493646 RepID=A0AAE0WCD5_9BIVA|nr:hypothetical protein CHS0354_011324 [Potamilus streckersoni]